MPPSSPRTEKVSRPVEPERAGALAGHVLQRQHAHADQVADGGSARSSRRSRPARRAARTLGRPVAGRALPYSLPASTSSGVPRPGSAGPRRRSASDLAVGEMRRARALGPRRDLVAQADVREGAPHHHLVIAATGSVGVEVARRHAELAKVGARRRVGLDGPAGEMWSVVIESPTITSTRRALDVARSAPSLAEPIGEERRLLHVGRVASHA